MNRRQRARLLKVSVAASPVLVAALMLMMSGSGPRAASAKSTQEAGPEVGKTTEGKEWKRAAEWIKEHRTPGASPFEAAPLADTVPQVPTQSGLQGLRLTGVFRNGNTALAAINGKVHGVGQEIAPGVTVAEVDVHGRKVKLQMPDGRVLELSQEERPRSKN